MKKPTKEDSYKFKSSIFPPAKTYKDYVREAECRQLSERQLQAKQERYEHLRKVGQS